MAEKAFLSLPDQQEKRCHRLAQPHRQTLCRRGDHGRVEHAFCKHFGVQFQRARRDAAAHRVAVKDHGLRLRQAVFDGVCKACKVAHIVVKVVHIHGVRGGNLARGAPVTAVIVAQDAYALLQKYPRNLAEFLPAFGVSVADHDQFFGVFGAEERAVQLDSGRGGVGEFRAAGVQRRQRDGAEILGKILLVEQLNGLHISS